MGTDAENYCTKSKIFEVQQRATFFMPGLSVGSHQHEHMDMAPLLQ
jgi:hypothetical protein